MEDANATITFLKTLQFEVKHIPVKRAFDIIFSSLALILGCPLFLFISFAIAISSRGKIIYSHQRVGRGGRLFKCYKFRTMFNDADERLREILASNPEFRQEWEQSRKLKKDPRVTMVGAFLRKTSLDELPQFWNVLIGDLSVVGPRAVVEDELRDHFGMKAIKVFSIRPGITGLWQVSGRSDTSYSRRIQLDEEYVEKHSLLMDLKLIGLTVRTMFSTKGAY